MRCKKCAKKFSYDRFLCPHCGAPHKISGMIVHIRAFNNSKYEKIVVCGKEIEITLFDGCFENMLSDHMDVNVLGLVVGHHEITPDSDLWQSMGIVENDSEHSRYVLGITFSEGLEISDEESALTEKTVNAFIGRTEHRPFFEIC